jgi:hypothetical protein
MVAQITQPYTHVVMHRIWHSHGYANTQDAMGQTQRIQVAVSQKKRAGNEAPYERKHNQYRVWNMRCGE